MANTQYQRININLPAHLVTAAKNYAELHGTTLTELVRAGLKEHVVQLLKAEQTLPDEIKV